jgi:hypothetical protein
MTTYTAQLTVTARTAWETWYQASDVATRYTEAAIAWYVSTFFSEDAQKNYATIGEIIGDLMVLTVIAGMMARRQVQPWIDAQVEGCIAKPEAPAKAQEDAPADPFCPTVNPHYPAAPVERPQDAFKLWVLMFILKIYREVKRLYGNAPAEIA